MVERDDYENDDYEDQLEQMVLDNGVLLRAVVNLLLRKGIVTQDEVDEEMDSLFAEIEAYEEEEEGNGRE